MKVMKPQKLALLTRTFEFGRQCFFSVAVICFFPFEDPRKLLSDADLWKFVPGELGKDAALDAAMPKIRAEVLVAGVAHPPGGKPAIACAPRVQLGKVEKTLRVVGNRVWRSDAPTPPQPFTAMPITWENAFGGSDYKLNPVGKGSARIKSEHGEVQYLPNVEDPKHPVMSPKDKPAPAGFRPYDFAWPQRFSKAGTYDASWLKQHSPGFAPDIDWSIFNTAPDDQQIDGFFTGQEPFVLDFLHPTKSRIEGQLPDAAARCFVNVKAEAGEEFREIPTKLDTVWLFPHAERGVLVFHGSTKVAEDDAADVLQIVAGLEEIGSPRPVEHYRKVVADRLDKENGTLASLRETELLPPWPSFSGPADPGDMQAIVGDDLLRKNQRKRAGRELEKRRAILVARGLNPDDYAFPALPPEEPPPTVEQIVERAHRAQAEGEERKKRAEAERALHEERLRQKLVAQGLDPEPILKRMRNPPGGPPRFSAAAELAKLEALAKQGGAQGAAFAAMASDPAQRQRLLQAEEKLRENYRFTAHVAPPAEALGPEASAEARRAVLAAIAAGESFQGRDLTGADLSGLQAPRANLAGAFLEGAKLTGADLSGADLSGAVLARADLSGANLRGARLCRANMGSALLQRAVAAEADFEEAVLVKADLSGADLQGARLVKANVSEATCGGANLSGVDANQVLFSKTDLSGLRLMGAKLDKCIFLEVNAEAADFSGAQLQSASFVGVKGRGAVFRKAQCPNVRFVQECSFEAADFSEANLEGANLRGSHFAESKFVRARLDRSDLSECDLKRADLNRATIREGRLVRTDLTEALLVAADLMGAILQKASIAGADFRVANLYQADFARVATDGRVQLGNANLKKVRVDPRRAS